MLTNDQWNKIDQKYGKLMYKISHQISGDAATATFEDNLQDIRLAAMEAVVGFEKQNNGANGKFEEFWGTTGFDRYIKTCMWTKKNNKGAKITKKAQILKGTVSTDKEEILEIEEGFGDADIAVLFREITTALSPMQKTIIETVVKDPTLVKPSGKLNVKKIAERLNVSWFQTDKHIKNLARVLHNEL